MIPTLLIKPVSTTPHPVGNGTHKIYRFPNNFGASVVQFDGSYGGNKGLWELAVIKFNSESNEDFDLRYDTHITDDVIGYLTPDRVDELLEEIQALERI